MQSQGKLYTIVAVVETVKKRSRQEALFVSFSADGGGRVIEPIVERPNLVIGEACGVPSEEIHKACYNNCKRRRSQRM
ncbi:hypothetical protein BHE74_00058051 [Ensete ventricosum]|nr:hypothetical protein BHE74_00058051 [Ensete ventricosum]